MWKYIQYLNIIQVIIKIKVLLLDELPKTDLSKLRGKEATAELRRKKQEKLDQQKKLLDRKVQARWEYSFISYQLWIVIKSN